MKKKKKESKWNLLIYIPYMLGGMGIAFTGAFHIQSIPNVITIGLLSWTFQIGLCGVVIAFGIKGFNSALEQMKKVF